MSQPITFDILSDSDDDNKIPNNNDVSTPLPIHSKKQKTEFKSNPTVFLIDDDPTPRKSSDPNSTPSFVPETPMSEFFKLSGPIVRCNNKGISDNGGSTPIADPNPLGISGLICLESDAESGAGLQGVSLKQKGTHYAALDVAKNLDYNTICVESPIFNEKNNAREPCSHSSWDKLSPQDDMLQVEPCSHSSWDKLSPQDDTLQLHNHPMEVAPGLQGIIEAGELQETIDAGKVQEAGNISIPKSRSNDDTNQRPGADETKKKKKTTKEEKGRLMEEKKQKKEQEKLQKAALKAEAAEMKKMQKEKQKWENGKLALKSIVAEIDKKVIELVSVGGTLLTRLSEKGLAYRITSNPIERSIVWSMAVPEQISQVCPKGIEIPYVLLICEASDFCDIVANETLMEHVSHVRCRYPSHTVCYLTNRLMYYINKREQEQYKNPSSHGGWKRPPIEELLSNLTTRFVGVHSRLCIDEAELAEHVVGLTCSLASCQFRKKMTRLSVYANGSLIPKDCVDRNLIKKSMWLKALVAIPKVQPRFAIAIWKKYPTMKSLLTVYMDTSKSVHEKEFLLKDLIIEGLLGEERRLGEICSKRVYRILMAQSGNIKTDDVENGADFFNGQSS